MVLTPAGTHVLQSATEVLQVLERTEDDVRGLAEGHRGMLRVSAGRYTGYHWLPAVLKAFGHLHPDIDVRLDAHSSADPVPLLLDGAIDVGIVCERANDPRIAERPLFDDEWVVVVDRRSELAGKPSARPADFSNQRLLLDRPMGESGVLRRVLAASGIEPASVEHVAHVGAIIELVRAGLGFTVLPAWVADPYVGHGGLARVAVACGNHTHRWTAIVLKEMEQLAYVRAFVDTIARAARPHNRGRKRPTAGARAEIPQRARA
jgi:LysR family transcriptional regulator, regulator for metE and metH